MRCAIGRLDAMELGRAQAPARRIDIDADQLADPWFCLEQRRDERAELAPHPADEYPLPPHNQHAIPAAA